MKIYRLTIKLDSRGSIVSYFTTHSNAEKSVLLLMDNQPELWTRDNAHYSIEEMDVWEEMIDLR